MYNFKKTILTVRKININAIQYPLFLNVPQARFFIKNKLICHIDKILLFFGEN